MALPSFVGRFEVRDEIGTGGFATVLRAWDVELACFVALKILRPELADDEETQLRFLEEARLLRRIRSPNVVTVHDVGRLQDGRPYFVMDYADRGTLAPRLKGLEDAPAPDTQTVKAIVDAMADGIAAIHEAGVVHRDIKPANILFQLARRRQFNEERLDSDTTALHVPLLARDERILVSDLGIAKDLAKRGTGVTILGGTPLYQAPEQLDPSIEVTPVADVYSATAVLLHVLTGKPPPPTPSQLEDRLTAISASMRPVIKKGIAPDPSQRFESIVDWQGAIHEAMAKESSGTEYAHSDDPDAIATACPYKGLAAYQPEDARFFFGREALIDDVVRRLQTNRVLVVAGPSGSGKSSLVRAGLIPALAAGALHDSARWRVALFTPGRDPMAELYYQVSSKLPSTTAPVTLDALLAHPTMARHLGGGDRSDHPLLLCIDQFEELFTLTPESQRQKFIDALSSMADPADSVVRLVVAVRADFYGACAQFPWLADRISSNQVLVGPMTPSELRRAITEPARPAGLHLERALVEAIVDDAGSEAGSLPLVAHALVETWARRTGSTLTLEGYRAAGGVAGAISQTADAMYTQRFDSEDREATKRLFLRLVTPGEGAGDTRRSLARSEIDTYPSADTMHRVVDSLTEARLLTVDDVNVEIAHEALLRTWPRLRAWIEESRDELRTRQRISRASAEWDSAGRDSDLLYRGTPLLSAMEWSAKNPEQLGELERTFLNASTESKAQADAISAERLRRARRVRRVAIALLSFLALGATLSTVIAVIALRDARMNAEVAASATVDAHERFASALGSAAHGLVDSDPLLALVLGAEAVARAEVRAPGFDARSTMLMARRSLSRGGPFLLGSPIAAGDAYAMSMTPDGSLVASAQRDGQIVIIDTVTRRQLGPSLEGHDGGVRDVAIGRNGRLLASGGADGTVRLWELGDGLPGSGTVLAETGDVISGLSVSRRKGLVAAANGDGTVWVWDPARKSASGTQLIKRPLGFNVVAFSPDARGVVAAYSDGTIFGWRLPGGEPAFAPIRELHTSNMLHVVFSPSGDRFATVSTDGTSNVIEFPSGRVLGRAFDEDALIGAVTFTPDGAQLIGGGDDGALKLWTIDDRASKSGPRGHSQPIMSAQLSGDGKMLVTLGRDQLIRTWQAGTSYPQAVERTVRGRSAKGLAFSGDGDRVAAGDDTGLVHIWSLAGADKPSVLPGHGHQVWALAFSADGELLASGDRAGEVRIWRANDGTLLHTVRAHDAAVWWLGFTSDAKQLVTASDGQVRIWDAGTAERRGELTPERGRITRAALSPDDRMLAAVTTDGTTTLWDLERSAVIRAIAAEDNVVWSVRFSPDGRWLATASSDEVVALWDVETGQQRGSFTGHVGGATDVAFLADGVTLLATDRRGGLHVWDAESGRRLVESWRAHQGTSWRLAVHPDGERFATAGDDGTVKVWDQLSLRRACEIAAVAFDAVRRKQYLGDGERSMACD